MSHILAYRRKKDKKRRIFRRVVHDERKPKPKPKHEPKREPEPILVPPRPLLEYKPGPKLELPEPKTTQSKLARAWLKKKLTVVTVNFKTPDLTYDAVTSFKQYYPDVPYVLIDNGGCTKSLSLGRRMAHKEWVHFISNSRNVGHGLALNQGLAVVETPYAFLLDSDTKTERGGFLEKMLAEFDDDATFAVGWLRYVNKSGVAYKGSRGDVGYPYIHPYACMLDVAKFHALCPFVDSNAPATHLMRRAVAEGFALIGFPVGESIWHKVAGTRGLFRGNCHPDTNAQPGTWHKRTI